MSTRSVKRIPQRHGAMRSGKPESLQWPGSGIIRGSEILLAHDATETDLRIISTYSNGKENSGAATSNEFSHRIWQQSTALYAIDTENEPRQFLPERSIGKKCIPENIFEVNGAEGLRQESAPWSRQD